MADTKPVYQGAEKIGAAVTKRGVHELLVRRGMSARAADLLIMIRCIESPDRFDIVEPADVATMIAKTREIHQQREPKQ